MEKVEEKEGALQEMMGDLVQMDAKLQDVQHRLDQRNGERDREKVFSRTYEPPWTPSQGQTPTGGEAAARIKELELENAQLKEDVQTARGDVQAQAAKAGEVGALLESATSRLQQEEDAAQGQEAALKDLQKYVPKLEDERDRKEDALAKKNAALQEEGRLRVAVEEAAKRAEEKAAQLAKEVVKGEEEKRAKDEELHVKANEVAGLKRSEEAAARERNAPSCGGDCSWVCCPCCCYFNRVGECEDCGAGRRAGAEGAGSASPY